MQDGGVRHRLLVILAADAAGYSRLMAADDVGSLRALDSARQVFASHIHSHSGRLIDTAGDSVLAAFESAIDAVSAAMAVQRDITGQSKAVPEHCRMLFRIGIHLGDVLEKEDGTVYGDGVNIAARLQELAQPGGIAISQAVQGAVSPRLRAAFEDMGEQVFKNIATPLRTFRALQDTPEKGAASAAQEGTRPLSTLPTPHPPLIGRDDDLAVLEHLLAQHRLVTVLGAGGIGKTSLALWAAHAAQATHGDGAAWIELAPISNPALLYATVARAVGLPVGRGDAPLPSLLAGLKPRRMLLVLDNAEHLLDVVAPFAESLIHAAPEIHLLVTSQAALKCEGEHMFRLGALAVPEARTTSSAAARYGAVALFIDQAQAANHHFALTEDNVDTVIDVCRRLDGIPLALKLAAARMPLFGLAGLASQLTERLRVLGGGSRNAPPRQQTLRAALDWSYGLLNASEQAVFRTLGVFVGGFTLEFACALTRLEEASLAADETALVDALAELVDRSFVVVDRGDPPRYQLLESAREYALDQLRTSGQLQETQHHHAKAMLQILQRRSESAWVTSDAAWLAFCAPELDNMRAAIEWSMRHDPPLAVALMGSSTRSLRTMGLSHEHRRRSAELAAHLPPGVDPAVLAEFWFGRTQSLAYSAYGVMHECASKAVELFRQTGDARGLYLSLCYRASTGIAPPEDCRKMLDEIAALHDPQWPPRLRMYLEFARSNVFMYANDGAAFQAAAGAGLSLAKLAGADRFAAVFEGFVLRSDLMLGNVEAAVSRCRDLVARERLRGGLLIVSLGYLALALLTAGDARQARAALAEFFDCCRSAEWEAFDDFSGLAVRLALLEQRYASAARLVGFLDKSTHRLGRASPSSVAVHARALALLASRMDEATLERLIAQGRQMSEEDVCALALDERDA
ncbi:adenylate/guanylate cyclase domain-containing protein [Variovorax sp. J22R133]|uniref:adenylate/guanylate cyclase domain-containing protein n=1 Tax=Variovorax brevis TaxID=3053503 RepID=UPI002577BD96|nr:adenylate/guanylate cyclase domain-containing protein [Variovorax sp. J22R133]MDM0113446.1 adenylate/guanylate cyclase domain-containing protein [Variovorax sp. J22R133]